MQGRRTAETLAIIALQSVRGSEQLLLKAVPHPATCSIWYT